MAPGVIERAVCPVCLNVIPARRNGQKYCSVMCARRAAVTEIHIQKVEERNKSFDLRQSLATAYEHKCRICGWSIPGTAANRCGIIRNGGCEIHHIVPVSEGGTDDPENLIMLCPNCHKSADANIYNREWLKTMALTGEEVADLNGIHIRKAVMGLRIV